MPVSFSETFVTWQLPREGWGTGAPYLSIISCVRQTWVVCGPPPKGDPGGACIPGGIGDCCHVMVLVVSHRPGFLVDCPAALTARANRQQPNVIKVRVERIFPPD
jgi:hypothetical protein